MVMVTPNLRITIIPVVSSNTITINRSIESLWVVTLEIIAINYLAVLKMKSTLVINTE